MVCEMKVREHELFKAYYCGLCKALKRDYRKSAVLNYDCTFIYLLADSLNQKDTDVRRCGCILHPVKKRSQVVSDCVGYAAAVNILMAYAKARDDVEDKGGPISRLGVLGMKRAFGKARARIPEVARLMEETAAKLGGLERQGSGSTDETADTYARLFGAVLQELDVTQSHILYDLGYSLGRWVYLIDAYDDIGEDIKRGGYNVFVNKYGLEGSAPDEVRQQIEGSFHYTLSQAMQALDRLELKKNRPMLQNIICLGLKDRTRAVLAGEKTRAVLAGENREGTVDEPISGSGRR